MISPIAALAIRPSKSPEGFLVSAATPHAAYRPQGGRIGLERILRLPFHRRTTLEFIEEVFQEDNVVLRLLRLSSLGRHQRYDALAIGGEIDVFYANEGFRWRPLGPQPRLIRDEGIALHRVTRHHDVVIQGLEEQLASLVRPHRIGPSGD